MIRETNMYYSDDEDDQDYQETFIEQNITHNIQLRSASTDFYIYFHVITET